MKFQKFLATITPIGIFGSALVGMIMLIVGAESGTPQLMIAGGIVIGVGIGVIAILNVIFKHISPPLETRLGLDKYVDAVTRTDDDDEDDDDDEVSNAHYEAILNARLSGVRTVTDIFDREDALNALMERSEMNGLQQHYEEESDKLWDDYEGEDSSETVDKLYELIEKYYAMYKQALPYFDKSKEAPAPEVKEEVNSRANDHESVEQEIQQEEKEEAELHANDHEVVEKFAQREEKDEVNSRAYDHEIVENSVRHDAPATPPSTPTPPPATRTGAAVGYKPMKKK